MHDDLRRLHALCETRLHVPVPSAETDLLESGLIDSLLFVTLLTEVEREFAVSIPLLDLDFARVENLAAIAELVRELRASASDDSRAPHAPVPLG